MKSSVEISRIFGANFEAPRFSTGLEPIGLCRTAADTELGLRISDKLQRRNWVDASIAVLELPSESRNLFVVL